MKITTMFAPLALAALAVTATPILAQDAPVAAGKWLYAADGKRLGRITKVRSNGVVELIVNGKIVRVPAATVTTVDGKLSTSVPKKDLLASR